MPVIQLPADVLRVGEPTPCALRNKAGSLVAPRGMIVATEEQRERLAALDLYVDEQDRGALDRALVGKADAMVRQNALIGLIAQARPDLTHLTAPGKPAPAPIDDPLGAWTSLQSRANSALHDDDQPGFEARLVQVEQGLLELLNGDVDGSLLLLLQDAMRESPNYSVRHAILVAVICELTARQLPAWDDAMRHSLRCAALTMNVAMVQLQNQLATQDAPITAPQLEQLDKHGRKGAARMRAAGVTDALWLAAVEQHHDVPPGPLAPRSAAQQLARLIQRADLFAVRVSPRRKRPGLSATAAAKLIYLDELRQPDDAGSLIIKAIGLYPPGALVRLRSGEVAVVLRPGKRPAEPVVASVVNAQGQALGEPLLRNTGLPAHEIVAGVAAHECKVRINADRLRKLV